MSRALGYLLALILAVGVAFALPVILYVAGGH